MKKIASITLCSLLLLSTIIINIPTSKATCVDDFENNDYYIETIITNTPTTFIPFAQFSTRTITKTKTATMKAADGTALWSVSITGTFTYDGTTSKCISCSHTAMTYVNSWRITSVTSHKSNNSATAIAIAMHETKQYSQAVTITCDKNGTIS